MEDYVRVNDLLPAEFDHSAGVTTALRQVTEEKSFNWKISKLYCHFFKYSVQK